MDSQRTTHILLVIIAVGMFFMIFLFMKERYFTRPQIEPVVWEETVPARPWTTPTPNPTVNPVVPTPTPNPTPTPAPTTQNISLVEGQSYFVEFTNATENHYPMKYCGPVQTSGPGYPLDVYDIFVPANATSCNNNQFGAVGAYTDKIYVKLKSGISKTKLEQLNNQYEVVIVEENQYLAGSYVLKINNLNLNSYTVAKKYFDTGYFDWTSMYQAYSVSSSN